MRPAANTCCLTCRAGRSIALPCGQCVIAQEGPDIRAGGVRPLGLCPVCGKLGDGQTMVKVGPMKSPAHDRCVFAQLGEGILNLPKEERRDRLRLSRVRELGNNCRALRASRPQCHKRSHRRPTIIGPLASNSSTIGY
jgi:hypothetical protein